MAGRPDEGGEAALGGSTTPEPVSPPAAVVVVAPPAEAPTWITPFMPRVTCTWQKYGKLPALGNLTWQESPTLVIWASPHLESSKRSSPWGLDPSPDTTGWVAPPATRKVTVPPGRMLALAGSHLLAAVPSMVTLFGVSWAAAGPPAAKTSPAPSRTTTRERGRRRGRRRAARGMLRCAPVGVPGAVAPRPPVRWFGLAAGL